MLLMYLSNYPSYKDIHIQTDILVNYDEFHTISKFNSCCVHKRFVSNQTNMIPPSSTISCMMSNAFDNDTYLFP